MELRVHETMTSSTAIAPQPSEGLTERKRASTNKDVKGGEKQESKALEFAHSFPIHKKASSSILSNESTERLSFRGFGNLGCKSLDMNRANTQYSL